MFFDVDGVVIDGWHAKPERRNPWDATIEEDLGINPEALRCALFVPSTRGGEAPISRCARGEGDLKAVLAEVLPKLSYQGSVDTFVDYWFRKDSNLNQDVLKVVRRLKRNDSVALYLATGQEHYRAAYLWNGLGLKALFDGMFYSARMGVLKDDIDFFAKINAQLGIAPSERPLFFDDMETVVRTARSAGWDAHVFDTVEDLTRNSRLSRMLVAEDD